VGAESAVKLGTRHLVVRGASGGVVGPPRTGIATQLLRGEESLLQLCALLEPKHGLNHPKLVIGLGRLSYLSEEWRVSGSELTVCGWS
jgi:hypothetical protein